MKKNNFIPLWVLIEFSIYTVSSIIFLCLVIASYHPQISLLSPPVLISLIASLLLSLYLYSLLPLNHAPSTLNSITPPSPSHYDNLGWGTWTSLLRGNLLIVLLFFSLLLFFPPSKSTLFSPSFQTQFHLQFEFQLLLALISLLAFILDFFDGLLARLTKHSSVLGEKLDIQLDGLGVAFVTLIAYQFGKIPWWYLLIGFSRYYFLAGIKIRQTLKLPVYELKKSSWRRWLAGMQMTFISLSLFPFFVPEMTRLIAVIVLISVTTCFVLDWIQITTKDALRTLIKSINYHYEHPIPIASIIRMFTGLIFIMMTTTFNEYILFFYFLGISIILGILPLVMSLTALIFIAYNWTDITSITSIFTATIAVIGCLSILIFGSDRYSLWAPDLKIKDKIN